MFDGESIAIIRDLQTKCNNLEKENKLLLSNKENRNVQLAISIRKVRKSVRKIIPEN